MGGLKHNRLTVAGKKPLTSEIEVGEIVINEVDKLLYSKDTGGTVISVGGSDGGADGITTDTTNFNNILSVADTDVQKALDTLDNLVIPTPDVSVGGDNDFTGLNTFSSLTSLNSNVKIVDFGTVVNNNRYVIANPFGNANNKGCLTKAELFLNGEWADAGGWGISSTGMGVNSGATEDGIILATGGQFVTSTRTLVGSLHATDTANTTSAPCRVIVTYIGGATNA